MYGNCIGRFVRQFGPDTILVCFCIFRYLFEHKLNKASRCGIFHGPCHSSDWCTGIVSDGSFANSGPTPFYCSGIVSDGLFANWRPTPSHSVSFNFNTFLPTNSIRRAVAAYLRVPTIVWTNVREFHRAVCSLIGARPRFILFLLISTPFCSQTE